MVWLCLAAGTLIGLMGVKHQEEAPARSVMPLAMMVSGWLLLMYGLMLLAGRIDMQYFWMLHMMED